MLSALHPPPGANAVATAKDPASSNIAWDWCRLMGLTPLLLTLTCL